MAGASGQTARTRHGRCVEAAGAVVQLRDAGVGLAQELEHAGLVGVLALLVEPARHVVRVELLVPIKRL